MGDGEQGRAVGTHPKELPPKSSQGSRAGQHEHIPLLDHESIIGWQRMGNLLRGHGGEEAVRHCLTRRPLHLLQKLGPIRAGHRGQTQCWEHPHPGRSTIKDSKATGPSLDPREPHHGHGYDSKGELNSRRLLRVPLGAAVQSFGDW